MLGIARDVIVAGTGQRQACVDRDNLAGPINEQGACFVTLRKHRQLRGCIGSLEARRPLIDDLVENAYAAAFRDPRFPPVDDDEIAYVHIHISVLSPAVPMQFESEPELLSLIRPGIDGLILEAGHHRGTFLPSVWEQVADAREFLAHLKLKAGLPAQYWSDAVRVSRYTTESFGEHDQ